MPLPVGGEMEWPPHEFASQYRRYREHAAWYAGDPNMLSEFYAYGYGDSRGRAGEPLGAGGGSTPTMIGSPSIWRMNFDRFWARAPTTPWRRMMLHIPMAGDIATTSADMLFSDPVIPNVVEAHGRKALPGAIAVQDRLDELVELDGARATVTEAAETAAALGGVYLRVTWDKDVEAEFPLFTSVDSDCAVPEFEWGQLRAVTFWRVVKDPLEDDKAVYRHLERHEVGYVLHGLYKGTEAKLGERMPISLLGPDWVTDDQESDLAVVPTEIDELTAVYVPNMRPNRLWRGSQLGRSDYDGVEAIMDSLDETWTSWMRDLRLGRARLMVPQEYMDKQANGQSSIFDIDQEVFEALPMAVSRDENMITPAQFNIRATEHMATATALMDRIVAASGYSAATFGLDEVQRGVTATEIISREKRTIVTRDKKIAYWKRPLSRIMRVWLKIDAVHFQNHEVYAPRIDWPDAVQEDPGKMSATVVTLRQAMAASTETLVKMVHPAWPQEEVDREVEKIMVEKMMVPVKPGGPVAAAPTASEGGKVQSSRSPGDIQGIVPEFRAGGVDMLPPGSTQGGSE